MLQAPKSTIGANVALESKVKAAAGVVAGSNNILGIQQAMSLVGFSLEEQRNMTLYQKVNRLSQKLTVVEVGKDTPLPSTVELAVNESSVLSVTMEIRTEQSGNSVGTDHA
jgi:hypothetical protein